MGDEFIMNGQAHGDLAATLIQHNFNPGVVGA
jgi:hypothetical protein